MRITDTNEIAAAILTWTVIVSSAWVIGGLFYVLVVLMLL